MGHGTQKADIDSVFQQRVSDLETRAQQWSQAFRAQSGMFRWSTPDGLDEPMDVPALHMPAWERNSLNQKYSVDVLGDPEAPGTVGDIYCLKIQTDFLAVEERAFRTRHATLPRAMCVAAGRMSGHGLSGQSIFSQVLDSAREAATVGGSVGGG